MPSLRVLYRDTDRMPYLCVLKEACSERGLELVIVKAEGREFGELLQRGQADVLAENYWGLQSFRARGEPFLSVASAVSFLNERLFIHPDLGGLLGLNGKRFAIRETGPQLLIPALWLKDHGLKVEQVIYSERETGRWGHWTKVAEGECQGCFVTDLYAQAPHAAGLKEIPIARYGFLGNVTLTLTEGLIGSRGADVQTLVDSCFAATRTFKSDRAATLRIMAGEPRRLLETQLEVPDDASLERIYETLRDELSDNPVPTADAIWNVWRMRLDTAPELVNFNPLLMWDLSFARRAWQAQHYTGSHHARGS